MKWLSVLLILLSLSRADGAIVYERFEQNGKVGIKDDQGHIVVPASFDALGWSDGRFSLMGQITGYRQGNRWGLLNLKKEFITKAIYRSLTYPGGNRVMVSQEMDSFSFKYGCIDLKGELLIPLAYDDISIYDLRAVVMRKNGARYEYGLVDLSNRVILPLKYKRITPLGTLRYAVQDFSGKTALCSEEGKWSSGFDIDSVSAFQHDLAILYKDLRQGIINRAGEVRLDPIYRQIRISEPGVVQTRKPDIWKIIDSEQRELHRIEADVLESAGQNRNRVTLSSRSGLVDSLFQSVLPLEYDHVGPVVNEKVVVKKNGKYGLLRTDQSVILPFTFDSLILQGHLVRARWKESGRTQWDLYDTVGVRKTITSYDRMDPYNGNFFPVSKNGYTGGIDRLGRERVACVYDSLIEAADRYCAVKFKGLYGVITLNDQWILTPQQNRIQLLPGDLYLERQESLKMIKNFAGDIVYFTEHALTILSDHLIERLPDGTEKEINLQGQIVGRKSATEVRGQQSFMEKEGLTVIQRDGKYGFVDSRGRLLIANRYEGAGDFKEGLAPVRLLGKWGFIDRTDQIVVQPTFDKMATFHHGVAQVVRNQQEGLIGLDGSVLLELRYDSIRLQPDGGFILIKDGLKGLADPQGKILLEPRFDELQQAGSNHMIVLQNGRFGLLTRDGLSVFPLQYDLLVYLPETGNFFARQKFPLETKEIK